MMTNKAYHQTKKSMPSFSVGKRVVKPRVVWKRTADDSERLVSHLWTLRRGFGERGTMLQRSSD